MDRETVGISSMWEKIFPDKSHREAVKVLIGFVADSMPRISRVHTRFERGKVRLVFVADTFNQNSCDLMSSEIGDIARGIFPEGTPMFRVIAEHNLRDRMNAQFRINSTLWVRKESA